MMFVLEKFESFGMHSRGYNRRVVMLGELIFIKLVIIYEMY